MDKVKHVRGIAEMIATAFELDMTAQNVPEWLSESITPVGDGTARVFGSTFCNQVVELLHEYADTIASENRLN